MKFANMSKWAKIHIGINLGFGVAFATLAFGLGLFFVERALVFAENFRFFGIKIFFVGIALFLGSVVAKILHALWAHYFEE